MSLGNTVIVIEHNLDVIKSADFVIDLGPEGGAHGGRVVASGTPEEITAVKRSYTGQVLKPLLNGTAKRNGNAGNTRSAGSKNNQSNREPSKKVA